MKKQNMIVLLILIGLLISLFCLKDGLVSFAFNGSINEIKESDIINNGDSITLEEIFGDDVNYEYGFAIKYLDGAGKHIASEYYDFDIAQDLDSGDYIKPYNIEINKDYFDRWVVVYKGVNCARYELVLMAMVEPTYSLECDKEYISLDDTALCTVSVKYYFEPSKIEFTLNASDYTIESETKGEYVNSMEKSDNNYRLDFNFNLESGCVGPYCHSSVNWPNYYDSTYGTYAPFTEPREMILLTFELRTTEDKAVDKTDNISLNDIVTTSVAGENKQSIISETVKQKTSNDSVVDDENTNNTNPENNIDGSSKTSDNPKTSVGIRTLLVSFVLLILSVILIIRFKKKTKDIS